MKKTLITALFLLSISFTTSELFAQAPPPPSGGHGAGGNQPANGGGGAPIGGGLGILLALGAAYGGKKLYTAFKQREELDA